VHARVEGTPGRLLQNHFARPFHDKIGEGCILAAQDYARAEGRLFRVQRDQLFLLKKVDVAGPGVEVGLQAAARPRSRQSARRSQFYQFCSQGFDVG
jgi:hypothetical protein